VKFFKKNETPIYTGELAFIVRLKQRYAFREAGARYSTVTDFARFLGLSTSVPFCSAT
jgi:hypothetical protein